MLTLFAIISFLSLIILITAPTMSDIITAIPLCLVGLSLIIWKKPQKKTNILSKPLHNPSFFTALFLSPYFGIRFYDTWECSSKVKSISAILGIPSGIFTAITTIFVSLCSIYFLYGITHQIKELCSALNKKPFAKNLTCCLIASIATVMISQIMINANILSMGLFKYLWGTLIVLVTILVLYCLSGGVKTSIATGTGLYMLISTINVYIYSFKGCLFEPVDVFSAGTAMNVMNNYSLFPIPSGIIIGWGIWIGLIIDIFTGYIKTNYSIPLKRRAIIALCCVVGAISVFGYTANLKTHHWGKDGAVFNGYILDFVSKFKEAYVSEPDGYSIESINKLADKYSESDSENDNRSPHIIVIMDEAFSDLGVLGQVSTDKKVTPFISSLKKNTVSGYALTSVYGGTTANSEYEFLTGNSMAWLSPNVLPYQQYIRSSTYSMVSYLKTNYNYQCIAMHPYLASGWNRPDAYSYLGFDKTMFVDDFPQKDYVRQYISDKEMFDTVIDTYEKNKNGPLFLFGVSMQNHGDYSYVGDNFDSSILLVGYDKDYPDVEQYLSLIHETDKAVENLISYFESVDEEVVIVFYGDHQPKLDNDFYNEVSNKDLADVYGKQIKYKVPFFIWTNYEIDRKFVECTSLNYLSNYVYDIAGIPLPSYNQFLTELEEKIPSINAHGYYSLEKKRYISFDEASEKEKEWLLRYEQLQYNSLFDIKNRNKKLFPTIE